VESGLLRIGHALKAIKEDRLYRAHYTTFEEFMESEFGKGRQYGYKLIKAYDVLTNLLEDGVSAANLPDTERLCRELARISDRKMRKNVWERAELMAEHAGNPVDTKLIETAAQEIEEQEEENEGEKPDESKKVKADRHRHKKEVLEQYRSAQRALSAHLAFEEWDENELASLNNLITSIAHQAAIIRERLKKHTTKKQPTIVETVISQPL
jgi:hypothetical protein